LAGQPKKNELIAISIPIIFIEFWRYLHRSRTWGVSTLSNLSAGTAEEMETSLGIQLALEWERAYGVYRSNDDDPWVMVMAKVITEIMTRV